MKKHINCSKNLIRSIFFILILLTCGQLSKAQDVLALIKDELTRVKKGEGISHSYNFGQANEKDALELLVQFRKDSSESVRAHVYMIKSTIRDQTKDSLIRQQITYELLEASLWETERNILRIYSILKRSKLYDFNPDALIAIERGYAKKYNDDLILIIGIAQVKTLIPRLQAIASGFDRHKIHWEASSSWFSSLALARMGKATNIDTLISAVELEIDLQKRIYHLLKDIAYTRHPDALKLLRKYLASTEIMPKISHTPGLPVSTYAAEYIVLYFSDYLVNFPVKNYLSMVNEDYQKIVTYFEVSDRNNDRR